MSEFFSNDSNDTVKNEFENGYDNIPEKNDDLTDSADENYRADERTDEDFGDTEALKDADPAVGAENVSGDEKVSFDAANNNAGEGEFTYAYNKENLAEHTGGGASYSFTENGRAGTQGTTFSGAAPRTNGTFGQSFGQNGGGVFSGYNQGVSGGVYGGYNQGASGVYGGYNQSGAGSYNGGGYSGQNHAYNFDNNNGNSNNKKAAKKKNPETRRAVLICLLCVLVSVAVGLGGSFAFSRYFSKGTSGENASLGAGDNTVVLYRSVETVKADGSDMTVSDVAALVEDSVVEITTEYVTSSNFFFGSYVTGGAGSGVIISTDGYIVTNNHVVTNTSDDSVLADKIQVRLKNGDEYDATVVGHDADSDIAVIKIDAENLTAAVWGDSDGLVVGEQIIAVGNPLGELGGTVTSGIVSSTSREVEIDDVTMSLIQIDAAVNHGNSGGGLFNMNGELVGIVNAKSEGNSVEGLGFAIPSNDAANISEQLLTHGYVRGKVYIGVSFYEANSGYFTGSGGESILYVWSTEEGYNDNALEKGDMVLSIDDVEVSTVAEIKSILAEHEVGDVLTFSILRGRTTMDVEVTCYEATPEGSVSFND